MYLTEAHLHLPSVWWCRLHLIPALYAYVYGCDCRQIKYHTYAVLPHEIGIWEIDQCSEFTVIKIYTDNTQLLNF